MAGLISVKVISSKIGPQGMALTGQFMNSTALFSLFATGALGVGIVKYLAEFKDDKEKQFAVIRTAFWIITFCSVIISLLIIIFSKYFSVQSFKSADYVIVYVLWGSFLLFLTLGALLNSVLNGLKLIPYLTYINIASTVLGLLSTIVLAHYYGVKGVLVSSNIAAFSSFCLHLYFFNKYKWFPIKRFKEGIDFKILKLFSGFILMTLVSGLLVPSIQLIVRNKIILNFSFAEAGYWQSVTRISDYYLGFITSVLAIYYLPRLSEITDKKELKKEIWNGYKIILPIVAACSITIWSLRFFIIKLLLTDKFISSASLYGFQFLGDFFKIASWLLSYLMLAKSLKVTFIISEIFISIAYVLLCYFFIDKYGLIGSVYGFCATYLLYFIAMFVIMKKQKFI